MTLRKGDPPRNYETFPSDASEADTATSHTTSGSKAHSAAEEALRLATQGSWGDNYINGTPATTATPTASAVDETEERYSDSRYPADPPPQYTPTDTTNTPITPTSPSTARQQREPVRRPSSPTPPSPPPVAEQEPEIDHHEEQPMLGTTTPQLESAQPTYSYNDVSWSRDKCKSHRRRKAKKACWFTFALILCLWLMLPALFNVGRARTKTPGNSTDPINQAPIPSWPKPGREYRQHENSRSIHGTFQLYDLLDLSTNSGSISVTVNPQEGEKPAVLRLSSNSGSIDVRMGDSSWNWGRVPQSISTNRTFDTNINAKSGSVSGSILHGHGGSTDITSKSGMIDLTITAVGVGDKDPLSRISTSSYSGSHHITVKSSDTVRAIEADHIAHGSGSNSVDYPSSWEGYVHAKSYGSGSVDVDGTNLDYQGGGREVWAKRGKGDLKGVEVIGKGSGSINFRC